MKKWVWLLGGVPGAASGYAYWYHVGLDHGGFISKSPWYCSLYGAAVGMLLMYSFLRANGMARGRDI